MKKMKQYWMAMLLVVAASVQWSCSDDEGYSIGDMAVDWVTVHVEPGGFYTFTGDTWGTMFPAAPSPWGYRPVEGQRAYLVFNPLYDNYQGYDVAIKPEIISPFLTKPVEELNEENEEEYANHPAYLQQIWISGGYMNMIFNQKVPSRQKHRVSLVKKASDQMIDEDGYIHLEYRYNTYGDTLDVFTRGVVCYNLNTLPLDEAKGIKLKVNDAIKGTQMLVFENIDEAVPETDRVKLNEVMDAKVE